MKRSKESVMQMTIPLKVLQAVKFITEFYYEEEEEDLEQWKFFEQTSNSVDPELEQDTTPHIFEYIKIVDDYLKSLNIKSSNELPTKSQ